MSYAPDNNGFPPGYFVVRSLACNRLLDIDSDSSEDGADVILYPETESSLVESEQRSAFTMDLPEFADFVTRFPLSCFKQSG